jgi:hypothetical protein
VGEDKQTDDAGKVAAGMYAQPDTENAALAEGLRKLMQRGQEPQK